MYLLLLLLLLKRIHVEGACQNQGTFESQDGVEIKVITLSATNKAEILGKWTFTLNGETTIPIENAVTAASLQGTINNLPSVDGVGVTREIPAGSGVTGYIYIITFSDNMGTDIENAQINKNDLRAVWLDGLQFETCTSCATFTIVQDGTGGSKVGGCSYCPGGWYIGDDNTERSSCTRCGPGEYQHESGSSWCDRCEKGKYNGHVAKTSCKDCKSGQFETEYKSHFCQKCMPGTVTSIQGASLCDSCPLGQYQQEFGQKACTNCPKGYHTLSVGHINHGIKCGGCAKGKYGPKAKLHSNEGCEACEKGRWSSFTGIYLPCSACAKGRWSSIVELTNEAGCINCKAGYYSSTEAAIASTACIACKSGKFNTNFGSGSEENCFDCPKGYDQPQEGIGFCQKCSSGKVGLTLFFEKQLLLTCTYLVFFFFLLFFLYRAFLTTNATPPHLFCSLSLFFYHQRHFLQPSVSPEKFASKTGQTSCRQCRTGRYLQDFGSTVEYCNIAPRGYYTPDLTTIVLVPEGFRSINCQEAKDQLNATGCTDIETCPSGKFGSDPPGGICYECKRNSVSYGGFLVV